MSHPGARGVYYSSPALVRLLKESFRGPAWHGPSVTAALGGLDAAAAGWRPASDRPNAWEIMLHLAYARYVMLRRSTGVRSHRFPRRLRKRWWPATPMERSESSLRQDRRLLQSYQAQLLDTVSKLTSKELSARRRGRHHTLAEELVGLAMHDAYHSGQIRLLRVLRDSAL
ncbi:MAG TPA: DinB family protein [Gemmatimonadaceae bacterium]